MNKGPDFLEGMLEFSPGRCGIFPHIVLLSGKDLIYIQKEEAPPELFEDALDAIGGFLSHLHEALFEVSEDSLQSKVDSPYVGITNQIILPTTHHYFSLL